ncbi:hypothetical protein HWN40_11095 [Methanolobus zinderi]|jgi:hypothetical protein|uniref:Uncharacterized protein n=1 Tax=Methanolobus zinderi TaxID=536044 RepID=A0A7D5E8V1_9EURY|nr:hypothetical protein [Methanolobus zinderi]KXS44653.1 MAG: hypothetical protein AWU59_359 [Methanolobus sp. T82-4]QLC50738.1 hypothetical protein HWN40_11095 [Methanolobus zinderi]
MSSSADIEDMLHNIDSDIHTILNMLKKKSARDPKEIVDSSLGAWDIEVDSEEFVDQLRRSSRLDWVQ